MYATIGINASDLYCRIRSSTITEKARSGEIIHVDVRFKCSLYVDSAYDKGEPVKEMVIVLKVCWLLRNYVVFWFLIKILFEITLCNY